MGVFVVTSVVADGSMYDPAEPDDETIIANRRNWLASQGLSIEDAVRVRISYDEDDFCRYRIVTEINKGEGMVDGATNAADALVTTRAGVVLFLPVADCVATVIHDAALGVLMVTHLGRHSLEQDGGVKSIEYLVEEFGCNPQDLTVWLSPAPGKASYPIHALGGVGMKEAVHEQLARAGVATENISDNPADTTSDDRYYSHSEFLKGRKLVDGRMAMAAVMSHDPVDRDSAKR